MENIYINNNNNCKLLKADKNTIKFLLDYSLSLNVIEAQGLNFENNLN